MLVTDVRMPPSHTDEGLRAAVHLRSLHPRLPVLVLSQYVEQRYARELFAGDVRGLGYVLKDRVAALRAQDWTPDELAVRGPEVALRYADTMRTSRMQYPKVLKRLGVDGTGRNWRTLTALVDLVAE